LEGGGRKARYAYLESLATKYGYDKIATGHTLDDNIETIIFNLARGSGLTGLAGIPVKRGKIIRPLIRINKDELITWLHRQDIPFVKDPTNKSLRFARNRIRLKIVPELQRLNSAAKENIARSSSNAAEEVEFISDMAVSAYGDAMLKAGKSKIVLDLKKLREYDTGLMKKVVQEAFRKLNRSENRLSSNSFSRILGVINGRSGAKSPVGDGVFIEQSQGQVSLFRVISRTTGTELRLPGITEMAGSNCRLETQVAARNRIKNLNAGSDIAYLDIRKMKDIRVRFWKNGDRIKPLGMNGHKLISDILIDRKVPEFERRHIPLVMSGNKVAWIAGVMISEEFKVGPETKKVLKLRLCAQS
jgi:tRNA(Ile)-lysidine synthase